MGNTEDLQQQDGQDTNIGSNNTSPGGQSENWEARFKGLQSKFNDLQNSVAGKDSYNTRVTKEKQTLEQRLAEISTQSESQINEARAEKERVAAEKQALEEQLAQAQAQLAQRERKDAVRRELTQNHRDLLPWFESGYLQVPTGEDGQPLSGEALDEFANGFYDMLGQRSQDDFKKTMSGTTPPQFGTSGKTPSGMNLEEMSSFLNDPANMNSPERDRVMNAYLAELDKGDSNSGDTGWM